MTIGLLSLTLRIPDSQSLKAKRQVLLGLTTRLRRRFNVSIAQTDGQDKWQIVQLGIACVGTGREHVNRTLSYLVQAVERERAVELVDYGLEFL